MLALPFFEELDSAETVLVAGAGGGFDVYNALPLYFALKGEGKIVHLANLSFADLERSTGRRLASALWLVTPDTRGDEVYFPELHLARHLAEPVYGIGRAGARPVREAYETLVERLRPDTILLVDGGTDSLMRGDEAGLGTPHEDVASIAAVHDLDVPRRLLACIVFGVDTYHGVCHAQFLEAVAELTANDAFLGSFSLLRHMPEVERTREIMEASAQHSIVATSLLSALEGAYGDRHRTDRTTGSRLYINPLMTFYWTFRLDAVANRILYLDLIRDTQEFTELDELIRAFREQCSDIRPWEEIPL